MRWRLLYGLVAPLGLVAACGHVYGATDDPMAASDGGPESSPNDAVAPDGSDASVDAPDAADASDAADATPPCNVAKPFGVPAQIVATGNANEGATLTDDELTIFVDNVVASRHAMFLSTRAKVADTFPVGTEIAPPVGSLTSTNFNGSLSGDGLVLFFASDRANAGAFGIYRATRSNAASSFGTPISQSNLSVGAADLQPFATKDDLWFVSDRVNPGVQFDVYRAPLLADGGVGLASPVTEIESLVNEGRPVVTRDGLRIFFGSYRAGTDIDIFTATRVSKVAAFSPPTPVTELNSTFNEQPTWISADSCRLYLVSDLSGAYRVYVATRPLD